MDISNILLLMNIFISVLHPIKHIPQIYHTINTKKTEDLSKLNIVCELGLNLLSLTSCILVYVYMGKQTFFLPIFVGLNIICLGKLVSSPVSGSTHRSVLMPEAARY